AKIAHVRQRECRHPKTAGRSDQILDPGDPGAGPVVAADAEWNEGRQRTSGDAMATTKRTGDAVAGSAREFLPPRLSMKALREAARGCRGCPLFLKATQTVFGEGPVSARVILVGEQPGNDEDLA